MKTEPITAEKIEIPKAKILTDVDLLKSQLKKYEQKILPALLVKHGFTPEQFVNIVVSEVKKNDKLLQCLKDNPSSVYASILSAAEIGLIPSSEIGEFYLIPRMIKNKMTATPLVGYKGLVSLLLRSGDVASVTTEVVYVDDFFETELGLNSNLVHKPNYISEKRDAKDIVACYAVSISKSGAKQFAVVTRKEIVAVKNMCLYDNDLYFNDTKNPNRWMERKIALNQLAKMLPKDFYSKKAIAMDNMVEGGAMISLDEDNKIKLIEGAPVQPTRFRNIYGVINKIDKTDNL